MMLKVLDPFFKKKHAGYVMPVKITGTYEHLLIATSDDHINSHIRQLLTGPPIRFGLSGVLTG